MNRGTGFITPTLAGHLPARVGLTVAVLGPQPDQVIAEHLLHPPIEVDDQP